MQARIRPLRWIGLASGAGVLLTAIVTNAPVAVVVPVMVVAGATSMAWNGLSVTAAPSLPACSQRGRDRLSADDAGRHRRPRPICVCVCRRDDLVADGLRTRRNRPAFGWYLLGRLAEISG